MRQRWSRILLSIAAALVLGLSLTGVGIQVDRDGDVRCDRANGCDVRRDSCCDHSINRLSPLTASFRA